jgi:hypothetical protein
MLRTASRAGTTLVLAFVAFGCASTQQGTSERAPTRIEVSNYNPLTVTVYAVSSGQNYRLGQINTGRTAVFGVPRGVNEFDLRILVDPIGSRLSWMTDPLVYAPGDLIQVQIESNLNLTSVTFRRGP